MSPFRVVSSVVLIGVLASTPAFAQDRQRRRGGGDRRSEQSENQGNRDEARQRAVPRQNGGTRQEQEIQRNDAQNQASARRVESERQAQVQRQAQASRQFEAQRRSDNRRFDDRPDGDRWSGGRAVPRPYYSYRGYGHPVIVPRVIHPAIVTVVPYRPYVYRPSLSIGVFYGSGGAYPYGYTPRGYYDPIPGHLYGGLRITGAPREAQVFADGYYVGIVNDFDGVFQHLNLEAGPHHIEIQLPGFEPVAFDMIVQPGRTMTYRAEMYPY